MAKFTIEEPVVQPIRRGRSVAAHPYNMSATEIKVRRWAIAAAAPVAAAVGLCGYLLCLFGNDAAPSPRLQEAATEQGVVSLAENLVSSMQKTCSFRRTLDTRRIISGSRFGLFRVRAQNGLCHDEDAPEGGLKVVLRFMSQDLS